MCGLSFAVALVLGCVTGSVSAADELCPDPSDIVSRDDALVTPREGTVDYGNYTFKGLATPRYNARAQVELRESQPFTPSALAVTFDNAREIRVHLVAESVEGRQKRDEFHNVTGRDSLSLRWDSSTQPVNIMVVNAEPEDIGKDVMLQIDEIALCKQQPEPAMPTTLTTTESSQQEYEYLGCYDEAEFQDWTITLSNKTTVDSCKGHCLDESMLYSALGWGYACFCGNAFDQSKTFNEIECCEPCVGNRDQQCGGAFGYAVFHT